MLNSGNRDQSSAAEIAACFQNEKSLLLRLAYLITADQAIAEESVVNACEITLRGHGPFRNWLLEWAKVATITTAIARRAEAIRACERAYNEQRGTEADRMAQSNAEERGSALSSLLRMDPSLVIAELDPLCRAVLVLRVAIRTSIQDCAIRLNVQRSAVVAANYRAMTWLHDRQSKESLEQHPANT